MKMSIKIFWLVLIASICYGQTIPNGGFESWSNGNPANWGTPNDADFKPVTKVSDKHSGSFALKGEIKAMVFPGMPKVVTPVAIQSGAEAEGFQVSKKHPKVSGFFKFKPRGGDKLVFAVIMFNGKNEIGTGHTEISSQLNEYTELTLDIKYKNNTPLPTKCVVSIAVIGPTTGQDFHEGTYFIVDDISLTQQ
jgi:hypothetical protein